MWWPSMSLTDLKPSRSSTTHGSAPRLAIRRGDHRVEAFDERPSVEQIGEAVVTCLVLACECAASHAMDDERGDQRHRQQQRAALRHDDHARRDCHQRAVGLRVGGEALTEDLRRASSRPTA